MAETFPAVDILRSAVKDVSFREQPIEMGDRFVHSIRFTLHPYNETWRIPMRDISPDDRQRVLVFLLARADDGEHFLWTPPDGVEEKQFRVDNWEAIQARGWGFDFDLIFRRVWEPATPQLSPTANSCDTGPDFWVARLTDPATDSNYNNSYRSRTFVTVGGVSYHVFPHAPTGTPQHLPQLRAGASLH
jgi:phage-related protein